MSLRLRFLIPALLVLGIAAEAAATTLSTTASCSNGQVTVHWTSYGKGADLLPEWTGYDVLRRPVDACGGFVRANASSFARTPGVTHEHSFTDVPPDANTTYEYKVIRVDAGRAEVYCDVNLGYCFGSSPSGWVSCPSLSAPTVRGTLVQIAGWWFVTPCPGSCYPLVYLIDDTGELSAALQPHLGAVLAFYGEVFCGTVEGCAMQVARYERSACTGVVPARRPSWAGVKILYR